MSVMKWNEMKQIVIKRDSEISWNGKATRAPLNGVNYVKKWNNVFEILTLSQYWLEINYEDK